LNCDKEFSVKTSHVKRGGGKFCSRLCVTQHNNKNRKYLNLVCKKCHKEFQSKNKGAKFCSRICYDLTREAEFLKERGVSRSSLYFRKNKEKIYEQRRKLRENPDYVEKQRKYFVEYRKKNTEASLKRDAKSRAKNKETISASQAKWLKNNRDKRLEHVKRYNDKKLGTPLGRFESSCRVRIRQAFKKKGFKKNSKTQKMLSCSFEELRYHIEAKFKKGMTWENYGHWSFGASPEREWVGDHIVPLDLAETEEELIALNHYSNLQPLWRTENASKSNKLILDMISPENKIRYKEIIERALKQRSR
jgi:hypothetical protein